MTEQETETAAPPAAGDRAKSRGVLATLMGLMAVLFNLASCGVLVWRVRLHWLGNHWAFETRLFYLPAIPAALWGVMELLLWRRRGWWLPVLVILSAAALAGLVFVLDYYNVLVQYERWIGRGFPAAWTR